MCIKSHTHSPLACDWMYKVRRSWSATKKKMKPVINRIHFKTQHLNSESLPNYMNILVKLTVQIKQSWTLQTQTNCKL